jgi:hypothetical protein
MGFVPYPLSPVSFGAGVMIENFDNLFGISPISNEPWLGYIDDYQLCIGWSVGVELGLPTQNGWGDSAVERTREHGLCLPAFRPEQLGIRYGTPKAVDIGVSYFQAKPRSCAEGCD